MWYRSRRQPGVLVADVRLGVGHHRVAFADGAHRPRQGDATGRLCADGRPADHRSRPHPGARHDDALPRRAGDDAAPVELGRRALLLLRQDQGRLLLLARHRREGRTRVGLVSGGRHGRRRLRRAQQPNRHRQVEDPGGGPQQHRGVHPRDGARARAHRLDGGHVGAGAEALLVSGDPVHARRRVQAPAAADGQRRSMRRSPVPRGAVAP
mmetsp:Transcript_42825/g.118502  ORF Transcript_42825/g.118502 Transcript_42825/m.118502 type:complete len:210 (-) Transcript_42825:306-935(-)